MCFSLQVCLRWSLPPQWASLRLKAMEHQASKCSTAGLPLPSSFICVLPGFLLSPLLYPSSSALLCPCDLLLVISTPLLCSCWLSLEGGLLYAFVGPAAAVVLVLPLFPLSISFHLSHQHELRVQTPIAHFLEISSKPIFEDDAYRCL